ncbi:MAG TPA: RNA methyltransferase [Burkholderiaceae bacterium]|nr:RNA methyltransferase [Burkholderiaceae bacterium]HQR71006.1 RNA methyltransferase [Burkholderiaceae bacterium]
MVRITSADNPLVRRLRRLADSPRACRESLRSIAEGVHLVEGALAAQVPVTAVVVSADATAAARALAERAAGACGTRVTELAQPLYDSIAPVEHGTGVLIEIAIARPPLPSGLAADAMYLDGVQDPGNAGTLLRIAAAAGVRHVAAATGTAFLWAPKVLRAAMGAHFALSIYEDVPPPQLAAAFRAERLAADAGGDEALFTASWGAGPTVWMFGSEGQGLGSATLDSAQRRLRIPIDPAAESLNVAAAAAVCLFEQRRRRG